MGKSSRDLVQTKVCVQSGPLGASASFRHLRGFRGTFTPRLLRTLYSCQPQSDLCVYCQTSLPSIM